MLKVKLLKNYCKRKTSAICIMHRFDSASIEFLSRLKAVSSQTEHDWLLEYVLVWVGLRATLKQKP